MIAIIAKVLLLIVDMVELFKTISATSLLAL